MSGVWMLVFSIALLLVVVGLVGLFAMMSELNAAVGSTVSGQDSNAAPIDEARIGHTPSTWPSALLPIRDTDSGRLIIFSSVCTSCREIATRLSGEESDHTELTIGVVSAADTAAADKFISETRIRESGMQIYVDPGGEWLGSELGIRIAPSLAVFDHGTLTRAESFADITALAT